MHAVMMYGRILRSSHYVINFKASAERRNKILARTETEIRTYFNGAHSFLVCSQYILLKIKAKINGFVERHVPSKTPDSFLVELNGLYLNRVNFN